MTHTTPTTLNIQQLGKDLVLLASQIKPWAPDSADRMLSFIEQARQSMTVSSYLVVSNLMLACDEAQSIFVKTFDSNSQPGEGAEILHRLNREISRATGQPAVGSETPNF